MFAYCGLNNKLTNDDTAMCEFEVLNELKDLSNRSDANCLFHTRFLFEFDNLPLEEQLKIVKEHVRQIRRATYSGSKSIHIILEFNDMYENFCSLHYKEIWNVLNEQLFEGKADRACSNPARLTRKPGAYREIHTDDGIRYREQKLIASSNTLLNISTTLRDYVLASVVIPEPKIIRKGGDGKCRHYDVIEHYLNTSYPNLTGNGDSAISLFKAVRCCMKYNDSTTLDEVLKKARGERWTEKELDRIMEKMNKYI